MKKTISSRISSLIIGISLFLALIFSILVLSLNRYSQDREFSQIKYFLDALVENKEEKMAREITNDSKEELANTLSIFTENENVISGTVYSPRGDVLVHIGEKIEESYFEDILAVKDDKVFDKFKVEKRDLAVYTSGIYVNGNEYGYLRLFYDTSYITAHNRDMSSILLLLLAIKSMLLIALLHFAMKRLIITPILNLGKDMQKVSEGVFDTNVSDSEIKEIDHMKNKFNLMSKSLKQTQENLEDLVVKRTKELTESRKMLEVVIDTMPTPLFYKDKLGKYIGCNKAYANLLGKTKQDIIGKDIFEIMNKEFAEPIYQQENAMLQIPDSKSYEGTIKTIYGDLEVIVNKATIVSETDEIEGLVAVMSDITDRKAMIEEIKYDAKFHELIADISSEFLVVNRKNIDQKILKMLSLVGEFFKVDRAYLYQAVDANVYHNTHEWCKKGVNPSVKSDMMPEIYPWIEKKIKQKEVFWIESLTDLPKEFEFHQNIFKKYDISSLISIPIGIENKIEGLFGLSMVKGDRKWNEKEISLLKLISNVLTDGLEKKRIEDQLEEKNRELERLSVTDKLTQLYNRLRIDEVLETELMKVKRYGIKLSVIILDIDYFKRINDEFGHQAGDQVLTKLSNILKSQLRITDTIGRWGGEEFIVICSETDINGAVAAAEKLRIEIENKDFSLSKITCSFGVTQALEKDSLSSLINRADEALYSAKEKGRNRIEFK